MDEIHNPKRTAYRGMIYILDKDAPATTLFTGQPHVDWHQFNPRKQMIYLHRALRPGNKVFIYIPRSDNFGTPMGSNPPDKSTIAPKELVHVEIMAIETNNLDRHEIEDTPSQRDEDMNFFILARML